MKIEKLDFAVLKHEDDYSYDVLEYKTMGYNLCKKINELIEAFNKISDQDRITNFVKDSSVEWKKYFDENKIAIAKEQEQKEKEIFERCGIKEEKPSNQNIKEFASDLLGRVDVLKGAPIFSVKEQKPSEGVTLAVSSPEIEKEYKKYLEKNQSDKELLPCPFCGGKAETLSYTYPDEGWQIGCVNINCLLPEMDGFEDEKEAIKAWNTRA